MKRILLAGIVMLLMANVSWAQHSHGTAPGKEGAPQDKKPQMMSMCPMMKMMEQHMKMKDSTPQLLELVGILEKSIKGVSAEEKEKLLQNLTGIRQQLEKSTQEKGVGHHPSHQKDRESGNEPSPAKDSHKQH